MFQTHVTPIDAIVDKNTVSIALMKTLCMKSLLRHPPPKKHWVVIRSVRLRLSDTRW